MKVASVSDFRKSLKNYIDAVDQDQEPLIVTRTDSVSVVVVPLNEYNSLTETEYLLRNPANRRHLEESIAQLERGETVEKTLSELKSYEQTRR